MSIGLLVILIITAYFAGALAAAPRLMRLIYQEKLAYLTEREARHEKQLEQWRQRKDKSAMNMPIDFGRDSRRTLRNEATAEGWWWSLVWPFALAYHALSATAFADEIAAQHAEANAKIIADYDKLLAERFDKELAADNPDARVAAARKLIRTLTRKEHS